jgi:hypothetical protein
MHRYTSTLLLLLAAGTSWAEPPSADPSPPAGTPASSADVYFYPKEGQSSERQDRDRYECYLWAHKQTGYDPSLVRPDLRRPVRVVAVPAPGHDTAAGAVTGAVIGATVARPHDEGRGAVIGAIAGAVLGSASDNARRREADAEEARRNAQRESAASRAEAELQEYRRALRSCLEGRGYAVQ